MTPSSPAILGRMGTEGNGRPSEYTPEEDYIILNTRSTKEVQEKLATKGYPERTPAAIVSRRKYLRETGAGHLSADKLDHEDEVSLLAARRRGLAQQEEKLSAQLADVRAEIVDVNRRLRDIVNQLTGTDDQSSGDGAGA